MFYSFNVDYDHYADCASQRLRSGPKVYDHYADCAVDELCAQRLSDMIAWSFYSFNVEYDHYADCASQRLCFEHF